MQKAFGQGNPEIAAYAEKLFKPIDAVLAKFQERARAAGLPEIQVGPMDGQHLEILTRMLRPERVVEIGTLGGYSGLCLARGMVPGGRLHSFEKNETHARIARENLEQAVKEGVIAVEVKVHVGPALENLKTIEGEGPFDLVFIDADKPGYPAYLEWAVRHLRVGGAVIADNTMAWGEVHRANEKTGNDLLMVGSLARYNQMVAEHSQLRGTLLPTAEGLTVAVKTS